jgi:hypothetical protein
MRIDIHCPRCGGNHFSLDDANADDAVVKCGDCGRAMGTLGQLKSDVDELFPSNQAR